jgi:hypothetical protein
VRQSDLRLLQDTLAGGAVAGAWPLPS